MQTAHELSSVLNKLQPLAEKAADHKLALKEHMQTNGPEVLHADGKTFTLKRKNVQPPLSYRNIGNDLEKYQNGELDVPSILQFIRECNKTREKSTTTLKIT
jgi:hypothetical protein